MRFFLALLACGLFAISTMAKPTNFFHARVIAITDGDTIKVLTKDKQQIKIRLAGIDCSERKQPWGKRAKQAISHLVFSRDVKIEVLTKDRYGRTIGRVFVGDENVNRFLVRAGHCWAYTKYVKDKMLFTLQDEAKANGRSFWKLTDPMPPWEWRKAKRSARKKGA